MFCSLNKIAHLATEDVKAISEHLLGSEHDEHEDADKEPERIELKSGALETNACLLTDDDSENDQQQEWPAWETTSEVGSIKADGLGSSTEWLRNCLIVAAPSMEFVVMAEVQSFVILERSVKSSGRMELVASVKVEVSDLDNRDYITSVYVLPLASSRHTEASQIDLTCIVVSLSTGWINFYTERGVLILREHVADGPISCIRFGHSFFPSSQELVALSENCLYVMDGASLFTALKTARNEVARGERSVLEISNDLYINAYCLQLGSLRKADNVQMLGIEKPTIFDQYATAAQNRTPLTNLASLSAYFFCSTSMSFATFLIFDSAWTSRHLISDAIQHFSSKITSAVPSIGFRSFFGLGQSRKDRPQKTEVVNSRRIRIAVQSKLIDPVRHCERSFVTFNCWGLVAVCDENARVLLVDAKSRSVLRIWKGYRNARCAFIESAENTSKQRRKKALFLAIFAPKRGILEVWSLRFGPRIAVFNVDPNGRLLSIPLAQDGVLFGKLSATIFHRTPLTAAFLSSDGSFKTINVPFHFAALTDANHLHDENLFKESGLSNVVWHDKTNHQLNFQPFKHAFESLKTVDYQKRLIERLIALTSSTTLTPDDVAVIIDDCIKSTQTAELLSYLRVIRRIVGLYIQMLNCKDNDKEMSTYDYEHFRDMLLMTVEEYNDLDLALESTITSCKPKLMGLSKFRDQFGFGTSQAKSLILNQKADRYSLALYLYVSLLNSQSDDLKGRFEKLLKGFPTSSLEMFDFFIIAWLNEWNVTPWILIENALILLQVLFARFKESERLTAVKKVESSIYHSKNPRAALFLHFLCRSIELRKREESLGDSDELNEWETLDDKTAWHLLTVRHLALMSLVSELNKDTPLGLSKFADKGYGFYREQIGKFVANTQFSGIRLIKIYNFVRKPTAIHEGHLMKVEYPINLSLNERILAAMLTQFPYSFTMELLLCDCAWESASLWFRADHQMQKSIHHLELAVDYLTQIHVVPHLQQGISLMIWKTFARMPFENLYKLSIANKGRTPQGLQLRKDVLVTELELPQFIRSVYRLLHVLNSTMFDGTHMIFVEHKYEDFMHGFFENQKVKIKRNPHCALTNLAMTQPAVNYDLVHHHIHLAIALELQLGLNLRRPLSYIFPDISQRAFFADFQDHPLLQIEDVDKEMKQQRQKFSEEVVVAIGVDVNNDDNYYERWQFLSELARDWRLNEDALRIKEIVMIYESNCDSVASKLFSAVQGRSLLARSLAPLALGRFRSLIETDKDFKLKAQRTLSYNTWTTVISLPEQFMPNFEPTLAETINLVNVAMSLFPIEPRRVMKIEKHPPVISQRQLLVELHGFLVAHRNNKPP